MAFPIEFRKVWALTRRDMNQWATYRSTALTTLLGSSIGVASWGLNATFRNVPVPEYNADYVSFLVVGILVANLVLPLSAGVSTRLNAWTLESILMTGPKSATLVLGSSLWPYTLSVIFVIPQVYIGVYIFGAHLNVNPSSFLIATLISSILVFSLAMIATGVTIVTKQADPITWGIGMAASIFAGMTFPIQHLNDFVPGLSIVSWMLPQTWIFHIMRLATLTSANLFDPAMALPFAIALVYGLALLPLSYYVFRISIRRAKKEGTLGWF
jgi:ABC-2 type transport system permease protein